MEGRSQEFVERDGVGTVVEGRIHLDGVKGGGKAPPLSEILPGPFSASSLLSNLSPLSPSSSSFLDLWAMH